MATKISLKQLSQEILDLISAGGGALTRDITSNVTVGAAPAGTKFPKNQDLTSFAETLLLKEITPSISVSFSGTGIKEMGTTVNGTTMVLTINNLPQVKLPINKIDFYIENTVVDSQSFVDGKSNYSYTYSNSINTTTTAKVVLTYSGGRTVQGSGTFAFVYGTFYGATTVSTIDNTIANTLITSFNKTLNTSKSFSWKNITLNDERFCYMYPASFGVLTSIKDGNGFDQTQGYTRYQVNIDYPTNGDTVSYYVYLLNDSTTGSGFTQNYA